MATNQSIYEQLLDDLGKEGSSPPKGTVQLTPEKSQMLCTLVYDWVYADTAAVEADPTVSFDQLMQLLEKLGESDLVGILKDPTDYRI